MSACVCVSVSLSHTHTQGHKLVINIQVCKGTLTVCVLKLYYSAAPSHTHTHTHTHTHILFFSLQLVHFQALPQRITVFYVKLFSVSSTLTPTTCMCALTASINLLFGRPLGLLPGSSVSSVLLPMSPLSPLSKPSQSGLTLAQPHTISGQLNINSSKTK